MGFWESFAQGFADGYAAVAGETPVRRLCREAGWTIDEEQGEHSTLSFRGDAITPRRDVTISQGAGAALASIVCPCRARFTSGSLPPDLPLWLLARSQQAIGGWYAVYHERDQTVSFVCGLAAPLAGDGGRPVPADLRLPNPRGRRRGAGPA
jgi:hypothetical protein